MNKLYKILDKTVTENGVQQENFASDILKGLSEPEKWIPCKYIYDKKGSRLFNEIMKLPEYYLTGCEYEIIDVYRKSIIDFISRGGNFNLIELGAGNGEKTKILINELQIVDADFRYVPIDISETAVHDLSIELKNEFSDLTINGIVSEYYSGLKWLSEQNHRRNVVLFLGSNIGNFIPDERIKFLSGLQNALDKGDYLFIGFDMKKDIDTIVKAYNDPVGVTAEFNLNLLKRINNELGGNFDLNKFSYYSTYDILSGAEKSCIYSRCRQKVHIRELNRSFDFREWEPIHTESSYKFSDDDLIETAVKSGFEIVKSFYDNKSFFADSLWRVIK